MIKSLLWYGFIYYTLFIFLNYFFFIFLIKIILLLYNFKINIFKNLIKNTLSFFIFFSFWSLIVVYTVIDNFYIISFTFTNINFFYIKNFFFWINNINLNLYFIGIYYFPYIYIFILITILAILFCLSYNINELIMFTFYCSIILIFGFILFFTDSLILFFLSYEFLLVPSFFILYKYAKTRRSIEASYLMFFWTQFGALFLIFSFLYLFFMYQTSSFFNLSSLELSKFEINFLFICWIFGFGVKLPLWPFYGWLPKAHVEASTNFSIFLSGVLVKFAFFGLLKCLITLSLESTVILVYPFLLIGIFDAVFKLFYQIDLKKLVAYSTVVEMHWLTICIISGQTGLMLASFCMLISHALLSSNSFLLVDAINRRYKTRLVTEVSGINFFCPKLFLISLINCLVFLGFPGSIFFIAEFLFFSFFFDLYPLLMLCLLPLLYFFAPTFFFRTWMNVLFGLSYFFKKKIPLDLNSKEFFLYAGIIFLMFWLGFTWQTFIF